MKAGVKAALLSGLVFPGVGQMYLKRYGRGLLFMVLAFLGLIIVAGMAAVAVLEGIGAEGVKGGAVDIDALANLAATSLADSGISINLVLLFVVCCWIYSVIDAYRIGKRRDAERA
jgi:hypothetical protein